MLKSFLIVSAVATLLSAPFAVQAQGVATGAAKGAAVGEDAAGPVGGRGLLLGIEQRPRFRAYAIREHRPSFHYNDEMVIGVELPERGVTYYEVPAEYGARGYRYTIVNGHPVLVDPRTRRVVEIID